MDIYGALVSDNTPALTSGLVNSGFTADQAQTFLLEASGVLMSAIQSGPSNQNADSIFRKIDFAYLASRTDIDQPLAISGMKLLLPHIMNKLGNEGITTDRAFLSE